jgi:cell division protease FtsH
MYPRSEFISEISVLLGGYLTEKYIFKEVTTGATSDLRRATDIAKRLVTDYGMSENLGLRTFGEKEDMIFLGREIHEQKDYSEKMAEKIDEEIYNIIEKARIQAEDIIKNREDLLRKVAKVLFEKETLDKEEFEKIVGKKEVKKN